MMRRKVTVQKQVIVQGQFLVLGIIQNTQWKNLRKPGKGLVQGQVLVQASRWPNKQFIITSLAFDRTSEFFNQRRIVVHFQ